MSDVEVEELGVEDFECQAWRVRKRRIKVQIGFCLFAIAWMSVTDISDAMMVSLTVKFPSMCAGFYLVKACQDALKKMEYVERLVRQQAESDP